MIFNGFYRFSNDAIVVECAREAVNSVASLTSGVGDAIYCRPLTHGTDRFIVFNNTDGFATLITEIFPDSATPEAALGKKKVQNIHTRCLLRKEKPELVFRYRSNSRAFFFEVNAA